MLEPLLASVEDCRWVFVNDLQGRISNLTVGISLQGGRMTALAQWSPRGEPRQGRFCLATDRDGIARVLTMAHAAVRAGEA